MIPTKQSKRKSTKPCSDSQKLAQQENFAIFSLRGMLGNLVHLKRCASVPQSTVLALENNLISIEKKIKFEQAKRKKGKSNGQA